MKSLLLVYFLLLSGICQAQMPFEVFNTSNSDLPFNTVNVVIIDESAFVPIVWIGTEFGLASYSNNTWTVFTEANSGLSNNSIRSLFLDVDGSLWVGTFLGGLSKYDGATWTTFNTSNSAISDNYVRSIARYNGALWIGTTGGLNRFDGINWTVFTQSNTILRSNNIASLQPASDRLYVGTINGGLSEVRADTIRETFWSGNSLLSDNTIRDIAIGSTPNSILLACPAGGLYAFDGNSAWLQTTTASGLPSNELSAVAYAAGQAILGFEQDGFCPYSGICTPYLTSNSDLPDNHINDITLQSDGVIWLATEIGGLVRFDPSVSLSEVSSSELFTFSQQHGLLRIDSQVEADYSLYSAQGKRLANKRIYQGVNQISISDLSAGIYFLQIQYKGQVVNKRFFILNN